MVILFHPNHPSISEVYNPHPKDHFHWAQLKKKGNGRTLVRKRNSDVENVFYVTQRFNCIFLSLIIQKRVNSRTKFKKQTFSELWFFEKLSVSTSFDKNSFFVSKKIRFSFHTIFTNLEIFSNPQSDVQSQKMKKRCRVRERKPDTTLWLSCLFLWCGSEWHHCLFYDWSTIWDHRLVMKTPMCLQKLRLSHGSCFSCACT